MPANVPKFSSALQEVRVTLLEGLVCLSLTLVIMSPNRKHLRYLAELATLAILLDIY